MISLKHSGQIFNNFKHVVLLLVVFQCQDVSTERYVIEMCLYQQVTCVTRDFGSVPKYYLNQDVDITECYVVLYCIIVLYYVILYYKSLRNVFFFSFLFLLLC